VAATCPLAGLKPDVQHFAVSLDALTLGFD
jgi:hypothetical protein